VKNGKEIGFFKKTTMNFYGLESTQYHLGEASQYSITFNGLRTNAFGWNGLSD
jgi:hypothetical protein